MLMDLNDTISDVQEQLMKPNGIKTVQFYDFQIRTSSQTLSWFETQEKTLTYGEELDEDKLQFYSDKHFLKEPFYS